MEDMNWDLLPEASALAKTVAGLRQRNFNPLVVEDGEAALEMLRGMIPAGKWVMTGSSTTLEEIGFIPLLIAGEHPWRNWKDLILAEKDRTKQAALRRQAVTADYFLGSVQAITESGQVVAVDATGSRNGGYVYAAEHVIWVSGINKVVSNLDMAFRRVYEHCVPLEDARQKSIGNSKGTVVGKMVVYSYEFTPERVTTMLIKQKLGF
jgi:hypothetical protein